MRPLRRTLPAAAATTVLLTAACSSPTTATERESGVVKVGLIVTTSGPLAAYGQQWLAGFHAGLAYTTGNTGTVDGHKIDVTEVDDAADPAKAVSAAKDLIGTGTRIIGGAVASGVAVQVAPIAAQNKVLNISGPAATDAVTGINRYTFRSGRQTMQDIAATRAMIGDTAGKTVLVFAQGNAFGQANLAATKANLPGATVTSILVPPTWKPSPPISPSPRTTSPKPPPTPSTGP